MSHQFFSKIGQQLCSFKNSPFLPIGQKRPAAQSDGMLKSSHSFNPDRLFNKERYEQSLKYIEDKQFVDLKQQELAQAEKVEFQIMREATKDEFQRKIKALQRQGNERTVAKQHTPFRRERTVCKLCNKCSLFQGNFSTHPRQSISDSSLLTPFLSCLHCRCPMNCHISSKTVSTYRTTIWKHLKARQVKDEHLDVSFFVAAFTLTLTQSQQIYSLVQLLERAGYSILNFKVIQKWFFSMQLVRSALLKHGQQPGLVEGLLKLVDCVQNLGSWKGQAAVGQQFRQEYNMLRKVFIDAMSRNFTQIKNDSSVLVLLIRGDESINANQHKQFMISLEEYMNGAKLLHLSQNRSQSLLEGQQFFPQDFRLQTRLFLLPNRVQNAGNIEQFRDCLDYNNYQVLLQNVLNIRRDRVQQIFNFLPYHQLNFLLDKDVVSQNISKLPLLFAAKAGRQFLTQFGNLKQHLQVQSQENKNKVLKQLFPMYGLGQRCLIVLRPYLIGSGCEELLVNLLRLNNFIIIQRSRTKLTQHQAQYLSLLQHISQQQLNDYIDLMTTDVAQLLLVSKRSGLFEAQVLLNSPSGGLANIIPRCIRNIPIIQIKRGKDTYRQEINLNKNANNYKDIFLGGNLLNMEWCLFGSGWRRSKVLQNCRNKQIIKIQDDAEDKASLKVTLRQRQQILWQLRGQSFNYMLFNSKSDKTTQQLVGLFFPECTQFESMVVVVKPSYLHLLQEITSNLSLLRYHIIFQKTVQLSRAFAQQLLDPLQKLKLDQEAFQQVVDLYAGQKITMICVSKISGRKELLSLLGSFNFVSGKTIIREQNCEQMLKEVLFPVWTSEQQFLKIFNRHLVNLEQAVQLITGEAEGAIKPQQKLQILQYFIGSFLGTKPTDLQLNTSIGRLSYYCTTEILAKYQSWYYATLSNIHPNYVPLLFQYRQYGGETLVIQSYSGEQFMTCIVNHYLTEQEHIKKRVERLGEQRKGPKRGSLVLFIWAKKIFQFIEDISALTENSKQIPIQIDGWGAICFSNNQYRGDRTEQQSIQDQKTFLLDMCLKYSGNRTIVANCKKMIESRVLEQRYKADQRRLLPNMIQLGIEECLRVIETGDVSKLFLQKDFEMIDPDHQRNTLNLHQMVSISLYQPEPFIFPKYRLLVEMLLFFERWKEQALEYREVFGQILEHLKSLLLKYQDLEFIEYELYLTNLKQLAREQVSEEQLRNYPNFRKNKMRNVVDPEEQVTGKNRKFIQQKQYFKGWQQHSDDYLDEFNKKYTQFNMKTLQQPIEPHLLNNPDDYLHQTWNNQQHIVNLLRDDKVNVKTEGKGLYVEYEKKLNQNQEKIKDQLRLQVQKLGNRREESLLRDNGLDQDLWYKRVKQGHKSKIGGQKVDSAISKQLQKLKQFKSMNNN